MKRADLALTGIVAILAIFVAVQAIGTLARRTSISATVAEIPERGQAAGFSERPARTAARDPGTTVSEALLAPESDVSVMHERRRMEAKRLLALRSGGTYIAEMLASYDSTIVRWPDRGGRPLRIWIQPAPGLVDWRADYPADARAAFLMWENATTAVRFSFVADSASSEVPLVWIDRFSEDARIGNTRVRGAGGEILGAIITVALHTHEGRVLPPEVVAMTLRHEVGHLLGLTHTADTSSIMQPRPSPRPVSDSDRATLRLLYSLHPGSLKANPAVTQR